MKTFCRLFSLLRETSTHMTDEEKSLPLARLSSAAEAILVEAFTEVLVVAWEGLKFRSTDAVMDFREVRAGEEYGAERLWNLKNKI